MSYKEIDKSGTIKWYNEDGQYHKEDGPAIVYSNGDKFWYINGDLHREDGPAVKFINGYNRWWINGVEYTEHEYKVKMRLKKLKELL